MCCLHIALLPKQLHDHHLSQGPHGLSRDVLLRSKVPNVATDVQ